MSEAVVDEQERRINAEIDQLLKDIRRIGPTHPPPIGKCLFGELFDDEAAQQYYEALVGTLKCAKKRGMITFKGQMLLKGMSDKVVISITGEDGGDAEREQREIRAPKRPQPIQTKRVFSYMKKEKQPATPKPKQPTTPKPKQPMVHKPKSPFKEKKRSEIDGHQSDSEVGSVCPPINPSLTVASDSEDYVLKSPRRIVLPSIFSKASSLLLPPRGIRPRTPRKPLLAKRWSDLNLVELMQEPMQETKQEQRETKWKEESKQESNQAPKKETKPKKELKLKTVSKQEAKQPPRQVKRWSDQGIKVPKQEEKHAPVNPAKRWSDQGMKIPKQVQRHAPVKPVKRWSDQGLKDSKQVSDQPSVEIPKQVSQPLPKAAPAKTGVPPSRAHSLPVVPKANRNSAGEAASRAEEEVHQLLLDIRRIGANPGEPSVKFGELFDDEKVQNTYEALVGTLRSAKRQGLIDFKGQMLLKGMHDNVVIHVVQSN